jgi:predicted RNA binding protein YcfA (HicA-like mRNA interferase family)
MLTNSRDIIRRLERDGYSLARITGSHHIFRNQVIGQTIPVPHPRKDLPRGTVRNIDKLAGWEKD